MRKNLITGFGEAKSVSEWAEDERCVVSRSGFRRRLAKGWTLEDALLTPRDKPGNSITHPLGSVKYPQLNDPQFFENKSIGEVADEVGCGWGIAQKFFVRHGVEDVKVPRVWPRQILMDGMTVVELCEKYKSDIDPDIVMSRIWRGWDIHRALTEKYRQREPLQAFGEVKKLTEWLEDPRCVGTRKTVAFNREKGLSLEESLQIPPREPSKFVAFGESKTLDEWALDERCTFSRPSTFYARIRNGLSEEEAISLNIRDCKLKRSLGELALAEFISGLGLKVIHNSRKIIQPLELDLYIPERKFGIEFNGIYWHSERYKSQTYHYDKFMACKEKGIQLVQIWQDEWQLKQPIVKQMLAHKLGRSELPKIGASKCRVTNVDTSECKLFLDAHHIQGGIGAAVRLGLRTKETNELVAVLLVKRSTGDVAWELVRYATSQQVPGGFSKLLSAFRRDHPGRVKTFADLCYSDGSLYEQTGWVRDKLHRPDYKYIVGKVRVHKSSYKLDRFKKDHSLEFVEGLTERELAGLNGLQRIFDAGKVRYILD